MGKNIAKSDIVFYFCDGGSCKKAGSEAVVREVRAHLRNNELWNTTHTIKTRCNGRCEDAPTCIVQKGDYWYKKLNAQTGIEMAKSHIEQGKPLEQHLLYQPDWDDLKSEAERQPVKAKPFEYKDDTDLGLCHITRGFSSDQYLYPLFLYLWEHDQQSRVQLASGKSFSFGEIQEIRFSKEFAMELVLENEVVELIIAAVPKVREDLHELKITVTEYYVLAENMAAGIRFKNKKGKILGKIHLNSMTSKSWDYITAIHLQGQTPSLQQVNC